MFSFFKSKIFHYKYKTEDITVLFNACKNGDEEYVKNIIKTQPDILYTYEKNTGETVLFNITPNILKIILNMRDNYDFTFEKFETFTKFKNTYGLTFIQQAAVDGDIEKIRIVIDLYPLIVTYKSTNTRSALEYAILNHDEEMTQLLLSCVGDRKLLMDAFSLAIYITKNINIINMFQSYIDIHTMMISACVSDDYNIVNSLISRYNFDQYDFRTHIIIMVNIAIKNNNCDIVRLLLDKFALQHPSYIESYSPLMNAVDVNAYDVVDVILKSGKGYPEYQHSKNGNTALHLAIEKKHLICAARIIKFNRECVNIQNNNGQTPSMLMTNMSSENSKIIAVLSETDYPEYPVWLPSGLVKNTHLSGYLSEDSVCPICLENIYIQQPDNLSVLICGHVYCNECKPKIKSCVLHGGNVPHTP